jgi:hypothetical protein
MEELQLQKPTENLVVHLVLEEIRKTIRLENTMEVKIL